MRMRDLRLRLRALFFPRRAERDLDDELTFHVEREARKYIDAGVDPAAARARARAAFGPMTRAAETCRDLRGISIVDTTRRDVAYALRTIRRAPIVALTIVGTISLGLGLIAAAFTIFAATVLRVDAVRDPASLLSVRRAVAPMPAAGAQVVRKLTRRQFDALRRDSSALADAFASVPDITSRIDGRMMEGQLVTGNFFQLLDVRAARGRTLTPDDDQRPAGRRVVVLSHKAWSRLFANDPDIIGRRVLIRALPYEVVGVAPEDFYGLNAFPPDYWAPLSLVGQIRPWLAGHEDDTAVDIVARLAPGTSIAAAREALRAWASRDGSGVQIDAQPLDRAVRFSISTLLVFAPLFIAFGLIVLTGCANVANLLLARGVARQREIGIRLSIGASRARIVRQLLTESLVLAVAAAACGLVLSRVVLAVAVSALTRTMPPELIEFLRLDVPRQDWRVVAFLVVAAVASTVAFGLLPALYATRLDLVRAVRGEAMAAGRPGRLRGALMLVQVTAATLLLIGAAIFLRSAMHASSLDPGLRMHDTVTIEIPNDALRSQMTAAVGADPSVKAIAGSWPTPPPLGRPPSATASTSDGSVARVTYRVVTPSYFDVLGIGILRGRTFADDETRAGGVAMISEVLARKLWPGGDALGRMLQLNSDSDPDADHRALDRLTQHHRQQEPGLSSPTVVIVGVTRAVAGLRIGEPEADVYVPSGIGTLRMDLVARVQGDPDDARRALLQRLSSIDPNLGQVFTMRSLARLETYPLRVGFWLTMVLGALALALTLSGIFSVLSYLVAQRSKEIGIRIALGATAVGVGRLIVADSMRTVCWGMAIGSGLAVGLARLIAVVSAGTRLGPIVDLFDPLAYVGSVVTVASACALAALSPARRASRVDPIATLRQE
jgi:predicted permease